MHDRPIFSFITTVSWLWTEAFTTKTAILTKFHQGSKQPLMCVVTNNSHYPAVKANNPDYHAFGKYWMQARRLLNYRLKFCWLKVICCTVYVNQTTLNVKSSTTLRGASGNQWPIRTPEVSSSPIFSMHTWRKRLHTLFFRNSPPTDDWFKL